MGRRVEFTDKVKCKLATKKKTILTVIKLQKMNQFTFIYSSKELHLISIVALYNNRHTALK